MNTGHDKGFPSCEKCGKPASTGQEPKLCGWCVAEEIKLLLAAFAETHSGDNDILGDYSRRAYELLSSNDFKSYQIFKNGVFSNLTRHLIVDVYEDEVANDLRNIKR